MKSVQSLLITFILCISLQAQEFAVWSTNNRTIRKGVEIQLTAFVAGVNCEDIVLKTDNGKISSWECGHLYTAESFGIANISVFIKTGDSLKKVGVQKFAIREAAGIYLYVNGQNKGSIRKSIMTVIEGVGCGLQSREDHDDKLMIIGFTVLILRNNEIKFQSYNTGMYFNEDARKVFKTLQAGDKLIFVNITAKGYLDASINVPSAEFLITD